MDRTQSDIDRELGEKILAKVRELNDLLNQAAALGISVDVDVFDVTTHFAAANGIQLAVKMFRLTHVLPPAGEG